MKLPLIAALLALTPVFAAEPAASEEGFVSIMDGKSFDGWKVATEHPGTWKIEEGEFVTRGDRAHLYYEGDGKPFKNFELKVDVMTEPGSNGGIYFHTKYQAVGWPVNGFECQVNNSHTDWKKTASIYDIANTGLTA